MAWWWAFLRVGTMVSVLPGFGEQSIPLRVRLGLAVAFATLAWPLTGAAPVDPGFGAMIGEMLVGLLFGLFLRFFVMALQIAGSIAAQSTSLSQIFGATSGIDPLPAMGHVLVLAGLALAMMLDLHVRVLIYMLMSYDLVPSGTIPTAARVAEVGTAEIAKAFSTGFSLALPFVVASLIYNITLGVINRAMPQLMVAFVGAPAITAGGLALLAIAAPLALQLWSESLTGFLANPLGGG